MAAVTATAAVTLLRASPEAPCRGPLTPLLARRRRRLVRSVRSWKAPEKPPQPRTGVRAAGILDGVAADIIGIALPAAIALAADPITALVDTAFVGHLGSAELAAVGVSISVFNLVSKLFNVPLLNVTTSFVAEQQAISSDINGIEQTHDLSGSRKQLNSRDGDKRKFLPSVSTSLALATVIGLMETVALVFGSSLLMDAMGISLDSPMRAPAEEFLTLRAYGAPAIVIALAAQGTFRGFMDTKTPLYAVGAGNLVNVILDFVLIFLLGLGVSGAAIATVTSEYVIALILLWKLNSRVVLVAPKAVDGEIIRYLKSGLLLIGRTIAVLLTMTLSTSLVARVGPVQMAAYQICLEVWLTVSLLNDAIALAGQALLASEYSKRNYQQARVVVHNVLQVGLITGVSLAIILLFGFDSILFLFTSDSDVLEIARSGIWFVVISQPINAIAFVMDGLYYGVSDFSYAAYSMVFAGLISSIFLLAAAPTLGLGGVWDGLVLFMCLRAIAGYWRLSRKTGPWRVVWSDTGDIDANISDVSSLNSLEDISR